LSLLHLPFWKSPLMATIWKICFEPTHNPCNQIRYPYYVWGVGVSIISWCGYEKSISQVHLPWTPSGGQPRERLKVTPVHPWAKCRPNQSLQMWLSTPS
jgi:hypothetical protein